MTQEQESVVLYQWIKGEKVGTIEEVDKQQDGFIYFKSGRRINSDLLNEYLMLSGEGAIPLKEDLETKQALIDPALGLKEAGKADPAAGLKVAGQSTPNPNTAIPDSPIRALLNKMGDSSKDTIEISLTIPVKIPKAEMYSIMEESFGEEVLEGIKGLALSQIDENRVYKELKDIVENKVKNYYE